MRFFDYYRRHQAASARTAKARLQSLVQEERLQLGGLDCLPQLRHELLCTVQRFMSVEQEQVRISLEQYQGREVLGIAVTLPGKDRVGRSMPRTAAPLDPHAELRVSARPVPRYHDGAAGSAVLWGAQATAASEPEAPLKDDAAESPAPTPWTVAEPALLSGVFAAPDDPDDPVVRFRQEPPLPSGQGHSGARDAAATTPGSDQS